jgi:hypothetical protein
MVIETCAKHLGVKNESRSLICARSLRPQEAN